MDDRQKRQIQNSHQQITSSMVKVDDVCDFLLTSRVLTSSMVEDILSKPTTSKQARELNLMMPKRGRDSYDKYYAALYDSGNEQLAELLEPYVSPGVRRMPDAPGGEHVGGPAHGTAAAPVPRNAAQPSQPAWPQPIPIVDELPTEWPDANFAPLAPTVQLCNLQDPSVKAAFQNLMTYPMVPVPRGEVLIINNVGFDVEAKVGGHFLGSRKGSDMDATGAQFLFEKLGFSGRIHTKTNLDAWDIRRAVGDAADRAFKTDSCFICVVLSHGTMGAVYGVDGDTISLLQLTQIVDGKQCPNLVGKPKLFFIQACQGGVKDSGSVHVGPAGDDPSLNKLFSEMKSKQESTDAARSDEPTKADLFVAVATFPGFVSWRNEKTGTWFIQALLYVFMKYAHRCHLDDMMKMVNELVSRNKTQAGSFKQVSKYESTLRKNFYFFPGLPEDQWRKM